MWDGRPARADLADPGLAVAELLRHPSGGGVALEPPARRGLGTEAAKRELEHGGPHLGPDSPPLGRAAEPGASGGNPLLRKALCAYPLRTHEAAVLPDEQLEPPGICAPPCQPLTVEGGELLEEAGPFDDGAALERAAREHGLEGVVAKLTDSQYRPGRRSTDWRKLKLKSSQELVVAGYTRGQGRRSSGIGALVLGVHAADGLRYAGNVGTGFTDRELDRLEALLKPLRRKTTPFAEEPKMPKVCGGDVTWVEPTLVALIEFAEWTHEGRLRAPVYLGLREDKLADEVVAEHVPMPSEIRRGARVLKLSNLDKPFWPGEGIRKGDLLAFYRDIAPPRASPARPAFHDEALSRRLAGQVLLPEGRTSHMPDWIKRARFPASTRDGEKRIIDYPLVNDELALLWMVNMGCIDMNAWTSRSTGPTGRIGSSSTSTRQTMSASPR